MQRFGAISWTRSRINTNLEIGVFVSVAVAHVSLQFGSIGETLRAARGLAPTQRI